MLAIFAGGIGFGNNSGFSNPAGPTTAPFRLMANGASILATASTTLRKDCNARTSNSHEALNWRSGP
ncbi:hypothetical protein UFOVP1254_36 [uncultured Caudovirales phage]|uniref:Uncharacterized protein n=1 Tax=uncultured Caudovirales phage TaxID=2100421 RepID=A0A6J5R9Y9_9CAUD|nr:hypothetical protein UFOVP1254_36 [uncultured Caudovirales phage]